MNHLICTHKRAYKPFPKYITKGEHMPESHRYYYLENKMNAEAYKSWQGSMVQMFTNLFVRLLVHFVMKNNLIRAVMEFFTCVKTIQKHFQI